MMEERSNGIQHELRGRCNKAAKKQVVAPEPHDHDLSNSLRTHVRVGVATRRIRSTSGHPTASQPGPDV